ncbi:MAG: SigE family RNA polymerase sigma factor [Kibdelosporangium sp.]
MRQLEETEFRDYVLARMGTLRRTAYLLCRDWFLADDLASITVGKLYRHWARARDMAHLDAYVRQILVRTWLDERARPWRREEPTENVPESPAAAEPDPLQRARLAGLLAELPIGRRAAVVLRFYCDMSVHETARIMGCSVGTVKSQTARALDTLRTRVAQP